MGITYTEHDGTVRDWTVEVDDDGQRIPRPLTDKGQEVVTARKLERLSKTFTRPSKGHNTDTGKNRHRRGNNGWSK